MAHNGNRNNTKYALIVEDEENARKRTTRRMNTKTIISHHKQTNKEKQTYINNIP